jgi:tetratricopeptide (TPR) repeat protein
MSQAAADSLVAEGDQLFRAERFGEAAARFERAVVVFPHHALGWRGLGHAFLCLGKPHEAASAFDKAIGLAPGSATALWGGALAHAEIGNKVIAKDYLRRTIALQPTWVAMAVRVPQLAVHLQTSARAADKLHAIFGAFSAKRFTHESDEALVVEVGRIASCPDVDTYTFATIGLANTEWPEPERPRIELIMASTVDGDVCPHILANLAFHLTEKKYFPVPGTMVRDVVAKIGAGELSTRLPHVYVQVPRAWQLELPLDETPPAITLAQVVPISEVEYDVWRTLGSVEFERELADRKINLADLTRR